MWGSACRAFQLILEVDTNGAKTRRVCVAIGAALIDLFKIFVTGTDAAEGKAGGDHDTDEPLDRIGRAPLRSTTTR